MCGIFGFYLKRKLVEKDIDNGLKSLKLLNHRGPDDSGYWYNKEKGIFLGHNRLAIIDTSKKNSCLTSKNLLGRPKKIEKLLKL